MLDLEPFLYLYEQDLILYTTLFFCTLMLHYLFYLELL